MTFQHSGHGCAGAAGGGVLGAIGIHLPDPKSVQDTINEHHDRVVKHVQEHAGAVHDRIQQHVDDAREAIQNHLHPSGGEGLSGAPLHLIFGDPVAAEAHHYSLAAIPVGGGVTMTIVALIAVICMVAVTASMAIKVVAVRC